MSEFAPSQQISANWALLPDGWHQHVSIQIDQDGVITAIAPAIDANRVDLLIPGMINVHSHAFQRGLAGRTHRFSKPGDDFWSWRTLMYSAADEMTPVTQQSAGVRVFEEFLRNGYTTVCEFHYTHGAIDRSNAEIPALMCDALLRASGEVGIRFLLLPVLYQQAGFGDQPSSQDQRSFVLDTPVYLGLIDHLRAEMDLSTLQSIGYAPHSLRAVGYDALKDLLDHRRETAPGSPVHIHVAEQAREINECMLATGKRPVEWLLESMEVDQSWCLIHATHISNSEMTGIIQSGATVGLCPTTEADLGDGHFPFEKYVGLSGSWAIGSDSNTSVSPVEEVRLLDYTSRLLQRRRNVFQFDGSLGSGTRLYQHACEGGRLASGLPVGRIEPESHADFVALSTSHALTEGLSADEVLNSYIYAGGGDLIDQVFVAGNPQL